MSKFKCTFDTENEIANGPLIFSQLETLTNVFINEIVDLQQDFRTKAEFANEQFMKSLTNEKEIESIFNASFRLQQSFTSIETELQTLEYTMQTLKDRVNNLKVSVQANFFCARNNCSCSFCRHCRCKTERQEFLELLQDTNRTMENLPQLLKNMTELREIGILKNPYSEIFAILSCLCETLNSTEKNLNIILDKISFIELQQLALKKQLAINC